MREVRRRFGGAASERTFVFLGIANLSRRLHQILLVDIVSACVVSIVMSLLCERGLPLIPDGKHSCFRDNVTKVSAVESIGQLSLGQSMKERSDLDAVPSQPPHSRSRRPY